MTNDVTLAHRTLAELEAFLPVLDAAPKDVGVLKLLVRRPQVDAREVLDRGELDLTQGLVGDCWLARGSSRRPDRSANPDSQLNIMSHPMVEFLAQDPEREPLAGDQLYLDLDLSHANLPAGSTLTFGDPDGVGDSDGVGDAGRPVIVVTEEPHTGCAKFVARFGVEAMRFVNGEHGKPRRLRGLCARVVVPGVVRPGDRVVVTRPATA